MKVVAKNVEGTDTCFMTMHKKFSTIYQQSSFQTDRMHVKSTLNIDEHLKIEH
jgi:hypothetical protein